MTEERAKKHLERMLRSHTPGSVLHLLADLYRKTAEEAEKAGDLQAFEQCRVVEGTLYVVGLGIDAALPQ